MTGREMKSKSRKSSDKGKGCLLISLTTAFLVVSGFYFLTAGIRDAKHIEQSLIDRFGWADDYIPPPDGSIDSQRIESFIRVREAVQADCADYQAVLISIQSLDMLETEGGESASESASTGLKGLKSAFGAGPKMVEFSTNRNRALLDEAMGLGEYLYIYLTAYGKQLAKEPVSDFSNTEEAYLSKRARKEYRQILANQLLALETGDLESNYPELVSDLREEIEALGDDSHTSPWPDGPAGKTRVSLSPYIDQLDKLYCPGIVKIELLQKNRGLQFEG